jgi:hypothetical protein
MSAWLFTAPLFLALQVGGAHVTGVVRDRESGEPLAGAVVSLPDLNRTAITDQSGRYSVTNVPAGPHHLVVHALGFAARTLHALVPRRGHLEINIALRRRPIALRQIEVRPAVPVRGLEDLDSTALPDRSLSIGAIRNHPLLAEPDVFLALSGGDVVLRPESPSGIHVRGGGSDQTAYFLDGIPILNPYHTAGTFSAWNADALERVQLEVPGSSASFIDALSAAVVASTRTPGAFVRTQSSVSTTQARLTVDGPAGVAGAGFVLALRSGFPGAIAPPRDPSYLRGESGDLIAKLEVPIFGGKTRIIAYDAENELAAARSDTVGLPIADARHTFEWKSRSIGIVWNRGLKPIDLQLNAWQASTEAHARWHTPDAGFVLNNERADRGVAALLSYRQARSTTTAGAAIRQSRTAYSMSAQTLRARTHNGSVTLEHNIEITPSLSAQLGSYALVSGSSLRVGPHARIGWRPAATFQLSGGYNRSHQTMQSLRNPESPAANIFPVDLWVGADDQIPIARSDLAWLAAEYRPVSGLRIGAQTFLRNLDDVVLMAPTTGEPFATTEVEIGGGTARGVALDAALSGARYGVVASYGWQDVDFQYGTSSYSPGHAVRHVLEAGTIVFPAPTFSLRLGAVANIGRPATALTRSFEWEACNLRDSGCEFGGSPAYDPASLGGERLPAYLRVDLGVRKHWHMQLAGRDVDLAVFGTLTNLFDRRNALAASPTAATGRTAYVDMRPLAPLVVGTDWRF